MRLEDVRIGMRVRVVAPEVERGELGEPDEGEVFDIVKDEEYPVCVMIDGYEECFKAEELEPAEVTP